MCPTALRPQGSSSCFRAWIVMGSVLVEGEARLRQGKKWKTRWLVLRKPSPVADCLTLFAYKSSSDAMRGRDPRKMLMLREVCVLQRVPPFDGVNHVLLMLCASQLMLLLGFDRLDAILAWEARVRHILGEVHSFAVTLAPGSMLEPGPAQLHCVNQTLALVRGCPPQLLTRWSLPEVRRYGAVPGGFVLEGGSRCAMGCGAVFLACDNGDQIRNLLDCVGQGLTPSRPPHGVLPIMPGMNMPNESGQREGDERALRDLESRLKRLSMSSQESSASSSSIGHVRSFTLPGMSSRSPDSNSGSSWLSLFSGSSSLSEPQSSTSEVRSSGCEHLTCSLYATWLLGLG
uniref:PH domain-containing protein n=1 Tax=Eptatretus burgeri TaxID=7764 RepID=A0A8C4R888_EPTBU